MAGGWLAAGSQLPPACTACNCFSLPLVRGNLTCRACGAAPPPRAPWAQGLRGFPGLTGDRRKATIVPTPVQQPRRADGTLQQLAGEIRGWLAAVAIQDNSLELNMTRFSRIINEWTPPATGWHELEDNLAAARRGGILAGGPLAALPGRCAQGLLHWPACPQRGMSPPARLLQTWSCCPSGRWALMDSG